MESKNLKIMMGICKVLGILAKIGFVCCIVGTVFCAVGVSVLVISKNIQPLTNDYLADVGYDFNSAMATCIAGLFACIGGIIVEKLCCNYFKMVRSTGTPFTVESAESFRSLGIFVICVPIVLSIISAVVFAIFKTSPKTLDLNMASGIPSGIVMLLFSFVLGYGAELAEKNADNDN